MAIGCGKLLVLPQQHLCESQRFEITFVIIPNSNMQSRSRVYIPFFFLFGLLFLFLPLFVFSQHEAVVIIGSVIDSAHKPVKFATVSLQQFNDSLWTRNTTCNADGSYKITGVKTGKYILHASAIGYKASDDIVVEIKAAKTYEQNISLTTEDKNLDEVKVISRKPPIQIRADKIVLNVAGSINSTGYNAFELLAKAPGVRILNNEDILISGKSGVVVYLDGKLLQIQGQEIIDFLQTLPAANIETIEIITHPSARYDAAGNAGIINIRTKKNLALGLNGNVSLTGIATPFKPKIEGSTNLNYRQKKYNLYGTYSYTGGNYRTLIEDSRSQDLIGVGIINFSQHYRGVFSRKVNNYKVGADYFLSKKSTIGLVVNGGYTNWVYNRSSTTDIFKTVAKIDSQLVSKTTQPKKYITQNYNISYLYRDSVGRELAVDATYGLYNTSASTSQNNNYINGPVLLRSNANTNTNKADITVVAIKADYTQKLWGGSLSLGAKASKVRSDNDLLFYNILNNTARPDTGRTNHFVYTEEIVAGYADYSFSLSKFDFQTGLRWEHTRSSGDLKTILNRTNQAVDTAYTNLFPNLIINYTINKNNNLGFAISRRINRPAYQTLNPFEFVLDELTYTKGNPFLKPKISYDLKLSHSYKSMLTNSLSYTVTNNYFLNYRDTLAGGKTFNTTINAGTQKYYVASSSLQVSPKQWWDLFIYAEGFYQTVNGKVNKVVLKNGQFACEISGNNTFRMGKLWSAEISGYWNSRYYDAPAIVKGQWSVDAGVQRKILNDLGTIRFSATDVFSSLKFSIDRNYGGLAYKSTSRFESRQYRLSFSYKFGNKNIKAARKQISSAAEEQGRLN